MFSTLGHLDTRAPELRDGKKLLVAFVPDHMSI